MEPRRWAGVALVALLALAWWALRPISEPERRLAASEPELRGPSTARGPRRTRAEHTLESSDPEVVPHALELGISTRLPNGLTVILIEDHSAQTIGARVVVKAGSERDPVGEEGTAHLLEHMLFKGSDRLGTADWAREAPWIDEQRELFELLAEAPTRSERRAVLQDLEEAHARADEHAIPGEVHRGLKELGADHVNASTSMDATQFYAVIPANKLEHWARLEAERFSRPVLRGLATERTVVLEEVLLRRGHAEAEAWALVRQAAFGDHAYARPIGGTPESLASITLAGLEAFHRRWYTPGNTAVVLVGAFDRDEALDVVRRTFGVLPADRPPAIPVERLYPWRGVAHVEGTSRRSTRVTWPVVAPGPGDIAALQVAAVALRRALRTSAPGVKLADVHLSRYRDAALFQVEANCLRVASCTEEITDTAALLAERGLHDADFRTARVNAHVRLLRSLEEHGPLSHHVAAGWIRGEGPLDLWHGVERIRRLDAAAVQEVFERHLSHHYIVSEGSGAQAMRRTGVDAAPGTDIDDPRMSAFLAELLALEAPPLGPEWLVPGDHYTVARDGDLVAVRNPSNTLFQVRLTYPLGWSEDPLLCWALNAWKHATDPPKKPTDPVWGEPLRPAGVELGVSCGHDEAAITLHGPGAAAEGAMALVQRALGEPVIRTGPGGASLTRLQMRRGALEGAALHGADSPWRYLPAPSALDAATPDDLHASLRGLAVLQPRVVYAGPHPAAAVDAFAPRGAVLTPLPAPPVVPPSERQVWIVQTTRASRIAVSLFRAGSPFTTERTAQYALLDAYLSGRSGLVTETLREDLGGVYHARTTYSRAAAPGQRNRLAIEVPVGPERAMEVAERLVELVERVQVDPARFERAHALATERAWSEHLAFRRSGRRIAAWIDRGHLGDAREDASVGLEGLDRAAFERFLAEEAAAPWVVAIQAPRSMLDRARLSSLAPVREVSSRSLVRPQ